MRLIAFVLAAGFVSAVVADEPMRNPFRDGTGKATPDQPAAKPAPAKDVKPDPVKQAPRVIRAAEVGMGRLVPDVAFTDIAGKPGKLSDFKSSKLLVVAMTDPGCPLCKK